MRGTPEDRGSTPLLTANVVRLDSFTEVVVSSLMKVRTSHRNMIE